MAARDEEDERALDEVAVVMTRIANGDDAAVFTLVDRWGTGLAAAVRRVARSRGAHLRRDEVDELVLEAALAIRPVAGSWSRDGGALPWVWAERRIGNAVDSYLGQWTTSLDELPECDVPAVVPPSTEILGDEPELGELLARLAREPSIDDERRHVVAQLQDALTGVANDRDRWIFLEVAVQSWLGDPSPATTVAELCGMQPAAVRQVCSRLRRRIRRYAGSTPERAGLADLPLVA